MDEPMESSFDPSLEYTPNTPNTTNMLSVELANDVQILSSSNPNSSILGHDQTSSIDPSISDSISSSKSHESVSPLLRPGSMVMMTLTEVDYENHYWPKLKTAIDQLLNMKPGAYIPISYEQMYSCVYKCVCKQFSERLYNDLLSHITAHMEFLNSELKISESSSVQFIETFSFLMHQYLQALSGIVPIFNYMNRFYVANKLKMDLNDELQKVFRVKVVDIHIVDLLKLLDTVGSVPFAISPPTMANVVKNLYSLNNDYAKLNPTLFSRYLPNILPPTDPALLDQYAREAHITQETLSGVQDFQGHNRKKRVYEDDVSVN